MKHKLISIAVAAVMTVTMSGVNVVPVFAAGSTSPSAISNTGNAINSSNSDKEAYAEGQAIVMFNGSSSLSEKSAMSVFGSYKKAITVEQVWNFEEAGDITENDNAGGDGMAILGKSQSSSGNTLSIALVKSNKLTTKQLISKLKKLDSVRYAEPNYRIHAASAGKYIDRQWHIGNTGQENGTEGVDLHIADNQWAKGNLGSKDVVVAVVDSGIDYTHPDLKDNIWNNPYQPKLSGSHGYDFINGDRDPMDDNGHGTHCAGIIGANGEISGINSQVSLMGLKVLDEEGSSYFNYEVDAYNYINRALNMGVNVKAINNSWGGGESEIFPELVKLVGEKGAVTVVAAGNEGINQDELGIEYPQDPSSDYMLSVAATNNAGNLADFSNYGKTTVDLAAPGAGILSSVSYDNYAPTLYSDEEQNKLSKRFDGYEGTALPDNENGPMMPETAVKEGTSTEEPVLISDKNVTLVSEITDEKAAGAGGHSLKLDFQGMKAGQFAAVKIPYTLDADTFDSDNDKASYIGGMMNAISQNDELGFCVFMDVPAEMELKSSDDLSELMDSDFFYSGYYFGAESAWNGVTVPCGWELDMGSEEDNPSERDLIILCGASKKGDHTVYIDDLGISKETAEPSEFGKYEFMSGTSMATPVVTGAIALAAAMPEYKDADAEDLIAEVISHVNRTDALKGKVIEGGVLDYNINETIGMGTPKITDAQIDIKTGQVKVKGRNLAGTTNVGIRLSYDNYLNDEEAPYNEVTVADKDKKTVTIDAKDAKDYIKKIVDISITTNSAGEERPVAKENVYLVNGKTEYS
ncbi:MAG: S8 family serine peptidase, partial [Firmicutes bacterium]|nr:S8 family serine peptidase [Bacillota bacterium]